ncbi:MAG: Xylose operon regulatory protein [Verrucomicrobiota bacterium]
MRVKPTPSQKSRLSKAFDRPRVALIFETSNAYAREVIQGIFAYARENTPWAFSLAEQGHSDAAPEWLKDWEGDGIIARIKNRRIAETVLASGLPAVDLSIGRHLPSLPAVGSDDLAIARLAADHFLERGFKHFAYCGFDAFMLSTRRGDAFRRTLAAAGHGCCEFETQLKPGAAVSARVAEIGEWLKTLPKPLAIFACHDLCGQHVLDACYQMGLSVPEEAAVLGVDNDEFLCEMTTPPLSSVIPNARRTGYEAARLLDRMIHGAKVPPLETWIEPLSVRLRQSTDILAVNDAQVATALRFIREHVCKPISADDVARAAHLPRRNLEKRFRRLLNRTLHDEVLSVRLNRVKQLLTETRLSLEQIAEAMNYEHPEYLSVVFKREVGTSPREYRRRHIQGHYVS